MNASTKKSGLGSWLRTPVVVATTLLAGCVSSSPSEDASVEGADLTATPHHFAIGMSNEVSGYEHFRSAAKIPASDARLCHVYTYWDVAQHDLGHAGTGKQAGLLGFMKAAEATCDEVLVTFQGPQGTAVTKAPTAAEFEQAFEAFLAWTDAGKPLAVWAKRLSFTAWNEPNNPAPDGNGLNAELSPESAAEYYLRARKHCKPSEGCAVAAGDFATNGSLGEAIGQSCENDLLLANTTTHCVAPSPYNTDHAAPTYLDRYKTHIVRSRESDGLGSSFTPEHWAYHPWNEVNSYLDAWKECSSYDDCSTRRILASLTGPWEHADIWDTEIGLGLQSSALVDNTTRQPCAAAFLVQLTDLSPRFTRLYFMKFEAGNGPLLSSDTKLRNAGVVLGARETSYAHAKCAPTGITVAR